MGLQQSLRELKALYFQSRVLGQRLEMVVWSVEMSNGTVRDQRRADQREMGWIQGEDKAWHPEFPFQSREGERGAGLSCALGTAAS